MTLRKITFKPIGVIHTPWPSAKGVPIQSSAGKGVKGKIVIKNEYIPYLKDLEEFSHLILLYYLHMVKTHKPQVIPFLDTVPRGLFSTRAPSRPNPIGLSVVRLIKIEENIIHIQDLDIIDDTPLLDIKPYVPAVDAIQTDEIGWLKGKVKKFQEMRADTRFE